MSSQNQETIARFLAGQTVDSPKPVILGALSTETIEALKRTKLVHPYDDIRVYTDCSTDYSERYQQTVGSSEVYSQAIDEFRLLAGACQHGISERNGRYSRRSPYFSHGFRPQAHIDGGSQATHNALVAIGPTTRIWNGLIRRSNDYDETTVDILDAEETTLSEGVVYLLHPTTAHCEPVPPVFSRNRFFMRYTRS